MKFKDFVLSCDNDELLVVQVNDKMLQGQKCSYFITHNKYDDYKVNKFYSWTTATGTGYESHIEVFLIK